MDRRFTAMNPPTGASPAAKPHESTKRVCPNLEHDLKQDSAITSSAPLNDLRYLFAMNVFFTEPRTLTIPLNKPLRKCIA